MMLNWNFQRGEEVLEKIPSVGEVWIFSGTSLHNEKILSVFFFTVKQLLFPSLASFATDFVFCMGCSFQYINIKTIILILVYQILSLARDWSKCVK